MKERKPRISVLTTVYNGEKYLAETIKSVLNQTFRDFEYIIIDDGSTDKTKKIIKSFKDKRIKYYYYGKNRGFENWYNVLNFGLEKCKGKYVARIDADDLMKRKRLEIQYNYLEKNKDIFMVGSSCEVIDYEGNHVDYILKRSYPSILYRLYITYSNSFIHPSIFFRNEGLKYPHSTEHFFYFNMLINGKKIKNIRDVLISYRINPEGLMATEANISKSKYRSLWEKRDS